MSTYQVARKKKKDMLPEEVITNLLILFFINYYITDLATKNPPTGDTM